MCGAEHPYPKPNREHSIHYVHCHETIVCAVCLSMFLCELVVGVSMLVCKPPVGFAMLSNRGNSIEKRATTQYRIVMKRPKWPRRWRLKCQLDFSTSIGIWMSRVIANFGAFVSRKNTLLQNWWQYSDDWRIPYIFVKHVKETKYLLIYIYQYAVFDIHSVVAMNTVDHCCIIQLENKATDNRELSLYQICRHWWYRNCTQRQPPVSCVPTIDDRVCFMTTPCLLYSHTQGWF